MGEGGTGVALLVLLLLIVSNFINIAKRRSFSAILQASDVAYRQHDMVIGRNKRPVERFVVTARCTFVQCTLLRKNRFFDQKVQPTDGSIFLKTPNCAMRHN